MSGVRADRVVPIAMEFVALDIERAELRGGDLPPCRVFAAIDLRANREAAVGRRVADEADDRLVRAQGTAAGVAPSSVEHRAVQRQA